MAPSSCFPCKVSLRRSIVAVVLLGLWSGPVFAKGPELSAIELYPAGGSWAYVQISGFTLLPKNEVYLCGNEPTITKSSYGKLSKIPLASGMILERGSDGVLKLTRPAGAPECVVPANLKLDKAEEKTPADLADRVELTGNAGGVAIPKIDRGVEIVLVDDLVDTEKAEYLLAKRIGTIAGWKAYLARYSSSNNSGDAKIVLVRLYVRKGNEELAAYQASAKEPQPDYAKLQAAKTSVDAAVATLPSNAATDSLTQGIQQEAIILNSKGQGEVTQYRTALATQTTGYSHLESAERFLQLTMNLAPNATETGTLKGAIKQETDLFDKQFVEFNRQLKSMHPDEAYEAIKPFRPFAPEYPRVQTALDQLYAYHVKQGKTDAGKNDPQAEFVEYKKAAEVKPGPEIDGMVKKAAKDAQTKADDDAVRFAIAQSESAEEDKDDIKAYEVLNDLTIAQKVKVATQLAALQEKYVKVAPAKARELLRQHSDIAGLNDEREVQHAYKMLKNCYEMSDPKDSSLQDRMESAGSTLGTYYQDQANIYLGHPYGTGANVGYEYLLLAQQYKNDSQIVDELLRASAVHGLRSSLSVVVRFEDGTVRGLAAADFANQLTNYVANGLEASNLGIKVVRPNQTDLVASKFWNFALEGTIVANASFNTPENKKQKTSEYRSGEPVKNDAWTKAQSEYLHDQDEVANARAYLDKVKGKKNIEKAKDALEGATNEAKKAADRRDAIPETRGGQGTEQPYTYTEQTNRLRATAEVRLDLKDSNGIPVVPPITISGPQEIVYTSLEGVKAEDSMGLHSGGDGPSPEAFLEKVDDTVRDGVLKTARETFVSLPPLILKSANRKAVEGDIQGAAELYMLYLNTTEIGPTPDRKKAQTFLLDNFNFHDYGDTPRS